MTPGREDSRSMSAVDASASPTPHLIGCAVTLRMAPVAARNMAEELLLLARECERNGKNIEFTIGGDELPSESP